MPVMMSAGCREISRHMGCATECGPMVGAPPCEIETELSWWSRRYRSGFWHWWPAHSTDMPTT